MRAIYLSIPATIWLTGLAFAAPVIPDCAGRVVPGQASVTRVGRDGVLQLEHGRAAVLEGIRLPLGDADRAPPLLANRALVALARLADVAPLTLAATPPQKDRYDRLRAQAFGAAWLQQALLQQGLARVALAPDRSDCAPELYEAEAAARKAGRGLWALPGFRVRDAAPQLGHDEGSFQLVEGRVVNVGNGEGRTFLDFSLDWRNGFSAVIAGEDRKAFRRAGFDLRGLIGRRIRLRGMVEMTDGHPTIVLSNPAQIEFLQ